MRTFFVFIGLIVVALVWFFVVIFLDSPPAWFLNTQEPTPSANTFTSQDGSFSFVYPADYVATEGDSSTTWSVLATTTGIVRASLMIPGAFQPNTNFSEATFTVGTEDRTATTTDCLTTPQGTLVGRSEVDINGVSFIKFTSGEGAAGNRYETTSYRALRNDECYAVEYTLHWTLFENYAPSMNITEFDRTAVEALLEETMRSFRFL